MAKQTQYDEEMIRKQLDSLPGGELEAFVAAHPEVAKIYNSKNNNQPKQQKKPITQKIFDYIKGVHKEKEQEMEDDLTLSM